MPFKVHTVDKMEIKFDIHDHNFYRSRVMILELLENRALLSFQFNL